MTQILDALLNSGVFIPAIWLSLGFFIAWLVLAAKHVVPLTAQEAETLWKIHKQETLCSGKKWAPIKRGEQLVGFECECGHKHMQKKHIVNLNSA